MGGPSQRKLLPDGSLNPRWRPRRDRRASGLHKPLFRTGHFTAWDGEGLDTPDGRHAYALLMRSPAVYVWNEEGLTTEECLRFLSDGRKAEDKAIHVSFSQSYDVNMMLGDVPKETLETLWKGWPEFPHWPNPKTGPWSMRYRHRKSFVVREHGTPYWGKRKGELNMVMPWMELWDTFAFFQSSFLKAIRTWLGEDYPDLEAIRAGKERRGTFTAADKEMMIDYCARELAALVKLMDRVREHMQEVGLTLSRWDGAGAPAAALLRKYKVGTHQMLPPPGVLQAAKHAYAGGRTELPLYGFLDGPAWNYDLKSAYPWAAQYLPALRPGHWTHHTGGSGRTPFSVTRLRWRFRGDPLDPVFHPFFWRDPSGAIYFPAEGEGWYWEPEVDAALGLIEGEMWDGEVQLLETWSFHPETEYAPFHFVPGVFRYRQELKDRGSGAEKAIKLAIDAMYGKLAQNKGQKTWDRPSSSVMMRRPTTHQLEWAGWITSLVRAALLETAYQDPEAVIFMATDGIFTTRPLPVAPGRDLGAWGATPTEGLITVQSGVYFVRHEPDEEHPDGWWPKYRGFDEGSIDPGKVLAAWKRGDPFLDCQATRFVGMGTYLAGAVTREQWRTWMTVPRRLSLTPFGTKRTPIEARPQPWRRMCLTAPTDLEGFSRQISAPYKVQFVGDAPIPPPEDRALEDEVEDSLW